MAEQYLSQNQSQRQSMVLAPQLRQSLELLQVSSLELRTLVQQEMQQNPTVEELPLEGDTVEVEQGDKDAKEDEESFKEEFNKLAKLDDEWRDYFQQSQGTRRYSAEDAAKRQFFLDSLSQPESLQEHLMSQLPLAGLNETERQAGELIIGSINDDGFLTSTLEDLASTTGFTLEHMQQVLTRIQDFDPIGVCARDLKECLMIQIRRLGKEGSAAETVVRDYLEALGTRKFPDIARAMKIPIEQVQEIARFISTLEPKPGRMFTSETPAYVLPEVSVQKLDGEYVILLNNEHVPHLHISDQYRQLMSDTTTASDVKNYIREKSAPACSSSRASTSARRPFSTSPGKS